MLHFYSYSILQGKGILSGVRAGRIIGMCAAKSIALYLAVFLLRPFLRLRGVIGNSFSIAPPYSRNILYPRKNPTQRGFPMYLAPAG